MTSDFFASSRMVDAAPAAPACGSKLGHAQAGAALAAWLGSVTACRVTVTWTTNRATMLSYRRDPGGIRLRLHLMFIQAQVAELDAIAHYISGRHALASGVIDAFVAAQMPKHRRPPTRQLGSALGQYHDLGKIFADVNAGYFHGSCSARIIWGRAGGQRRAKRSIQLGCYESEDNLIRMHPCLDQSFVPLFFVTGVVFHEMLHEVFGVGRIGQNASRRVIHPPEFIAVEQSHPDYVRCQAWEKQHLGRLLAWRP